MIEPETKAHVDAWNAGVKASLSGEKSDNPYPRMTLSFLHYNNGYMTKKYKTFKAKKK